MPHAPPERARRRAETLARIRPRSALAIVGGVAALALGGAWMGGTAAKASSVRLQAERIESAAADGFTEEVLAAAAGGLDPSALAIARRHDPYTVAGSAQRDRQTEMLIARLERLRLRDAAGAGLRGRIKPGAFGGDMGGSLDASRDLECLTQAAYYEARGEGRDGMRAVTQVVLNRVRHRAFPKTVCGVVHQGAARRTGCQFSFACDGSMRRGVNRAAWNRARDVASAALNGSVYAGVGAATHFHTTAVSPAWRASMRPLGRVGDHLFYTFGRGGAVAPVYTPARSPVREVAPTPPVAAVTAAGPVPYLPAAERAVDARPATGATPLPAPIPASISAAAAPAAKPGPAAPIVVVPTT